MIDFSMDEMLELARQAELQKRVEADGAKAPKPEPIPEISVVALLHPIKDDDGLDVPAGTQGTIVSVYNDGEAYCIELPDEYQGADRLGLATVRAADFRIVWRFGDPQPVTLPEDLRGKLGEAEEAEGHGAPSGASLRRDRG